MSNIRHVVKDVPDNRVNFMIAVLKNDFSKVTKEIQENKLWTLIGEFPINSPSDNSLTQVPLMKGKENSSTSPIRTHDVDILARTIWGEARGESQEGMEAIASVVVNRFLKKNPHRFGETIADVCLKPNQFSCWNSNDKNFNKLKKISSDDKIFNRCIEIAQLAVNGNLIDKTNGSDHYHTIEVKPDWSAGKPFSKKIGNHVFYNNIE